MTDVKICGINDAGSFQAAVESGADWVGFVFFPPSPRCVTPAQASAIAGAAPHGPPRVGLFVRPTLDEIARTLDVIRLDALQLYDADGVIAAIKARFGIEVWRAIGVGSMNDLPLQEAVADRLLIEPRPPAGATRPGGNAVSFDWGLTRHWTSPRPWILAGGLTPDNVAPAVRLSGASAVDVSSGVETSKGVKSPELIRAFIHAAKHAIPGEAGGQDFL